MIPKSEGFKKLPYPFTKSKVNSKFGISVIESEIQVQMQMQNQTSIHHFVDRHLAGVPLSLK